MTMKYIAKLYKECRRRLKYWNKSACAKTVSAITCENRILLFLDILWCNLRYGSFDEDYVRFQFYRKNFRERKRWLTGCMNYYWMMDKFYDSRAIQIFDHKDCFDKVFKEFMNHDVLIAAESTQEQILRFLDKYKEIIVKPADGALGKGIYKVACDDKCAVNQLLAAIESGSGLILEEVIVEHPSLSILNPTSVNTIRVITMLDRAGKPHIINTVAMIGADNGCVSNTHSGGCLCHIDESTGIIDHRGSNVKGENFLKHPISGIVLPGYQLPNWEGLLDYVKKLAVVVPSARYIGWDIVILENGYDVIEGNIHPGPGHQATDDMGRFDIIKSYL